MYSRHLLRIFWVTSSFESPKTRKFSDDLVLVQERDDLWRVVLLGPRAQAAALVWQCGASGPLGSG